MRSSARELQIGTRSSISCAACGCPSVQRHLLRWAKSTLVSPTMGCDLTMASAWGCRSMEHGSRGAETSSFTKMGMLAARRLVRGDRLLENVWPFHCHPVTGSSLNDSSSDGSCAIWHTAQPPAIDRSSGPLDQTDRETQWDEPHAVVRATLDGQTRLVYILHSTTRRRNLQRHEPYLRTSTADHRVGDTTPRRVSARA